LLARNRRSPKLADHPKLLGVRVPSRITDDVISRLRAGEHAAFELVYRELAPPVIGYLRSGGVADPESVVNDVFLAVLKQLGQLTGGPAGLRSLVFSIAHARVVDELRRRSRQPARISYLAALDTRTTESAENAAVAAITTERVQLLLDTLPDDQRAVIVLRVIADLSLNQVAEILGRSPGAIKQLQRRGLLALRGRLAGPREVRTTPNEARTAPGSAAGSLARRVGPHPEVTSRRGQTMTGLS
jgi:RNA polymerase sigma-70 factor (ECF subfamily)